MAEGSGDFEISKDEADRFREAFKKPEFRKLFSEYAEEISDPENKKKYEEELIALEKQRGVDMKYLHPKAGFVMKSFLLPERTRKIFINVCHSEMISAATSSGPARNAQRKKGVRWSVPYSLTPPREDLDKSNNKCSVVDAVFNPETFQKGEREPQFKQLLIDTIFDGLEEQLKLKVDREKVIFLRMPYKGTPFPSVIRKRMDPQEAEKVSDKNPMNIPYPPLKEEVEAKSHKKQQKKKAAKLPSEPEYTIVHRGEFTIQDFTNERESTRIKRPKELVVTVKLPGVKSAESVELDIFEKKMVLQCQSPLYKLDLALPYPIDEEKGKAKFDKSKKSLAITLPVLPLKVSPGLPSQQTPPTNSLVTDITASLEQGADSVDTTTLDQNGNFTNSPQGQGDKTFKLNGETLQGEEDKESGTVKNSEDSNTGNDVQFNGGHVDDKAASLVPDESATVMESVLPKEWSSKGKWICPPFSYRQDDTIIVFCLHTPSVKEKSLVKYFDDHSVQLTYGTDGMQKYSFYISFPESCLLDVDDCSLDIADENIVLILKKDIPESATGADLWERFHVGLNVNQTMEKMFLTVPNVQSVIEKIESLPDPWKGTGVWSDAATATGSLVAEGNQLDIEIRDPKKKDENDESNATNSAASKDTKDISSEDVSSGCFSQEVTSREQNKEIENGNSPQTESTTSSENIPSDINGGVSKGGSSDAVISTTMQGNSSDDAISTGVSLDEIDSKPAVRVEKDSYLKAKDAFVPSLNDENKTPNNPETTKIKLTNKFVYSLD